MYNTVDSYIPYLHVHVIKSVKSTQQIDGSKMTIIWTRNQAIILREAFISSVDCRSNNELCIFIHHYRIFLINDLPPLRSYVYV